MYDDKSDQRHPPYYYFNEFPICKEHEKRTCCKKIHSEAISRLFSSLVARSPLSTRCSNFYQKSLCSYCDSDIGVGLKVQQKSPVLCQSFCNMWFDACYQDYFDNIHNSYIRNIEEISFIRLNLIPCTDSSVICSPLHAITTDPTEFCSLNGFSIYKDFQTSSGPASLTEYSPECFNGIPAASVLKPGVRQRAQSYSYKKPQYSKKPKAARRWHQVIQDHINIFLENIKVPLPVIAFISIISIWTINQIINKIV
ncbi:putative signal peptide-containing protein [Cryptosporidium canis]|uniref:Signal peptide-containing protein n=1 Tax=Cryptosporidium canis TaxID=195482 RepID=A0ABQ8P9B6_9CRYT|nr:putative signal peptide-containing protein [Cryptosporidium canis]KAJ1613307.1 putative signal peptide-containing protein [Cryptosporidium canis]